jgi:hypothetical protein
MVVADDDRLTPTDLAIEAYERARKPQKLVICKGGHFDAYQLPGLNITAGSAVDRKDLHRGGVILPLPPGEGPRVRGCRVYLLPGVESANP